MGEPIKGSSWVVDLMAEEKRREEEKKGKERKGKKETKTILQWSNKNVDNWLDCGHMWKESQGPANVSDVEGVKESEMSQLKSRLWGEI